MDKVEQLLRAIVQGYVSTPEEVEVFIHPDSDEKGELAMINVKVAKADVGLCIGEAGANADALRRIVGMIGFRQTGSRVQVRIDAPKIPRQHFYKD